MAPIKAPVMGPKMGPGKRWKMSKEKTYAGVLGEWQKFLASIEANPDLAPMEPWRQQLATLLSRGVELSQQQAAMAASKQERSKQIQAILSEGQRLATGMRKMIVHQYGARSEKLTEFGLQPYRGRKVKAASENPEGPQPSSPASTKP